MKRRFLVAATALLMSAGVYAQDIIKLDSPVLDVFNFSYLGLNGTVSSKLPSGIRSRWS